MHIGNLKFRGNISINAEIPDLLYQAVLAFEREAVVKQRIVMLYIKLYAESVLYLRLLEILFFQQFGFCRRGRFNGLGNGHCRFAVQLYDYGHDIRVFGLLDVYVWSGIKELSVFHVIFVSGRHVSALSTRHVLLLFNLSELGQLSRVCNWKQAKNQKQSKSYT